MLYSTVGVRLVDETGERFMHLVALIARGSRVDGSPDERMPESYLWSDDDQSAVDRRVLGI